MGDMIKTIKANVRDNAKMILGTIGDALMKIMILVLFVLKTDMDLWSGLIMILFALEPFVRNYISLVFKGEIISADIELAELKKQLETIQELSEYRVQLSAIKGEPIGIMKFNNEWIEANDALKKQLGELEAWKKSLEEEKEEPQEEESAEEES